VALKSASKLPDRQEGDPHTLTVDEARRRILDDTPVLATTVAMAVRDGLGAVLGEDVLSPIDVPAHTNSAMDGYALRAEDLIATGPTTLQVSGTAYAGRPFKGKVSAGQCVRIMTGAPMPHGADTVVMQEHTQVSGASVTVHTETRPGQNVRRAGEDLAKGGTALHTGTRIGPAQLGLLASLGRAEVRVLRPLRVAFFSTGDELRPVGEPLEDGQIYDSNRYTLYAMLRRLSVELIDLGVVKDTPEALREAFTHSAAVADVIISTGGVSVGEADFVKQVLHELGEVSFWTITMKPGRPLAYGRIDACPFFGLPGNPVAVMVTFYQLVRPALQRMQGETPSYPLPPLHLPCQSAIRKRPGRTEFLRGVLCDGPDGEPAVRLSGPQGSGILRSMAEADCFIVLPPKRGDVASGETVDVQPFAGLI